MPARHSSDAGAPRPRHRERDIERLTEFPLVGPYKASKQRSKAYGACLLRCPQMTTKETDLARAVWDALHDIDGQFPFPGRRGRGRAYSRPFHPSTSVPATRFFGIGGVGGKGSLYRLKAGPA